MSLKGILYFFEETRRHKTPNIILMLKGGFKGGTGYIWHLFTIADSTRIKIPILPRFFKVINRGVNTERRQLGWYFMIPDREIANLIDYKKNSIHI